MYCETIVDQKMVMYKYEHTHMVIRCSMQGNKSRKS